MKTWRITCTYFLKLRECNRKIFVMRIHISNFCEELFLRIILSYFFIIVMYRFNFDYEFPSQEIIKMISLIAFALLLLARKRKRNCEAIPLPRALTIPISRRKSAVHCCYLDLQWRSISYRRPSDTRIFRSGRGVSKAPECICVIITVRSTARAIMRVIVWLTECPGQNDSGTLLFDQRTRIIAVATKRSRMRRTHHPIPQPSNCAKRTADNLSNEHEDRSKGGRGGGKGGDAPRNSHRHYYIATRASLVNGSSSCRFVSKRRSRETSF